MKKIKYSNFKEKEKSIFSIVTSCFMTTIYIISILLPSAVQAEALKNSQTRLSNNSANRKYQTADEKFKLEKNSNSAKKLNYSSNASDNNQVYSNAYNFSSLVKQGVDSRTGVYQFSMQVGQLYGDELSNPFALILNYQQNSSTIDRFGFGRNWDLNLTRYDANSKMLYLDGGQVFKVLFSGDNPSLQYDKGLNIRLEVSDSGNLIIVSKDGRRQYLNENGQLERITDNLGNSIYFNYDNDGSFQSISTDKDGKNIKLKIDFSGDNKFIYSLSADGNWQETMVSIGSENGFNYVSKIFLPQQKDSTKPESPSYKFNPFLINSVELPTGAKINLEYTELLSQNDSSVKAVAKHVLDPGENQPQIVTSYSYGNADGHNFLGHNGGTAASTMGEDPLYGTDKGYQYQVGINNGLTYVLTTYNKYHLVEKQETYPAQDYKRKRFSEIKNENFHAANDSIWNNIINWFISIFTNSSGKKKLNSERMFTSSAPINTVIYTYPIDLSESFENLPSNYAFPIKKEIRIGSRQITTLSEYNENGNLVKFTDADGSVKTYTYCKITEDNSQCKPDSSGFEKQLKKIEINSSSSPDKYTTLFYYGKYDSKESGLNFSLPIKSEQYFNENIFLTAETDFYSDKNAPFYGYPKFSKISNQNESFSNNYNYSIDKSNIIIKKTYGGKKVSLSEISAINRYINKSMFEIDSQGIKTTYTYDLWGRILTKTKFADTVQAKNFSYDYILNTADEFGNLNYVIETSPIGQKRKTALDGLGRDTKLYRTPTDADRSILDGNNFLPLSETFYDEFGRKNKATVYNTIYFNDKLQEVSATTELKYDLLGRVTEIQFPDGITQITEYDNDKNISQTYKISNGKKIKSPVTLKQLNSSDKLIKESILDPNGNETYFKEYSYDGFGRLLSVTDIDNKKTMYKYNSNGFLAQITSTNNGNIYYTYNLLGHVKNISTSSTDGKIIKTLGTREYDELGRLISETNSYGFSTIFNYNDVTNELQSIQIPKDNGSNYNIIHYSYDPITHQKLSQSIENNSTENVNYIYDSSTLLLKQVNDKTGAKFFNYYTNGALKSIEHISEGGIEGKKVSNYIISYGLYDRIGNLLSSTDANSKTTIFSYDKFGKIQEIQYWNDKFQFETAKYEYDELNRLKSEYFQNSKISRDYAYDDLSRIALLSNKLNGNIVTEFKFTDYFNNGNLKKRLRANGQDKFAEENYNYDNMNNLSYYHCKGELCPKDSLGNKIQEENYTFDAFNNINSVTSSLILKDTGNNIQNTTNYFYDETDPMRLIKYSNSAKNIFSDSLTIEYNCNGNITQDDKGNKYYYNELGQTISIKTSNNTNLSNYVYDFTGRQVLQLIPNQSPIEKIYDTNTLINERQDKTVTNYLSGLSGKVARIVSDNSFGNSTITYFGFDQSGSTVNEISGLLSNINNLSLLQEKAYSPYGIETEFLPTQQSKNSIEINNVGFDGQLTDSQSHLQFLGEGYRAYNPSLRHFMSYDNLSPFDKGGINGYSFAKNNPIMFSDPSGHMSVGGWIGMIFGIVASIALAVVVSVVTAGAASPGAAAAVALEIESGTAAATITSAAVNIGVASVSGAAIGATSQTISDVVDGKKPGMDVALSALESGLGGAVGSFASSAISGLASFVAGEEIESGIVRAASADNNVVLTKFSKIGQEVTDLSKSPIESNGLEENIKVPKDPSFSVKRSLNISKKGIEFKTRYTLQEKPDAGITKNLVEFKDSVITKINSTNINARVKAFVVNKISDITYKNIQSFAINKAKSEIIHYSYKETFTAFEKKIKESKKKENDKD